MFNLSDGVKKALILIPTQPLPARTRVALRRKHLANLELAKAHRANFLIIGHPKSGNTWLKVMISRLYQMRYDLPESKLINTDEFARKIPEIPRLAATNGYYSYEGEVGKLLAVDAPDNPLRHKPVLFLARNPIDIAVSWYHQFTKRQSRAKQELINHWIDTPVDRHTVQMWEFVRHCDIGLPSLIEYQNTWARNVNQLEKGMLVKYEELRAEPVPTLPRRTLKVLGSLAFTSFMPPWLNVPLVSSFCRLSKEPHSTAARISSSEKSSPINCTMLCKVGTGSARSSSYFTSMPFSS